MFRIEVEGRVPTLNTWLSGTHWRVKARQKKEWQELFWAGFIDAKLPKKLDTPIILNVTQFCKSIVRDVDNAVLSGKFCLDALKEYGYIPDDSPKYVSQMTLTTKKGKRDKSVVIIQYKESV